MRRGSLKRKIFGPQVCQLKTVSTEGFTPFSCGQIVSRINSTQLQRREKNERGRQLLEKSWWLQPYQRQILKFLPGC